MYMQNYCMAHGMNSMPYMNLTQRKKCTHLVPKHTKIFKDFKLNYFKSNNQMNFHHLTKQLFNNVHTKSFVNSIPKHIEF